MHVNVNEIHLNLGNGFTLGNQSKIARLLNKTGMNSMKRQL